jgi:hypothetical protein
MNIPQITQRYHQFAKGLPLFRCSKQWEVFSSLRPCIKWKTPYKVHIPTARLPFRVVADEYNLLTAWLECWGGHEIVIFGVCSASLLFTIRREQ